MRKELCYLFFTVNSVFAMDMEYLPPVANKKVVEIEEVFTPVDEKEQSTITNFENDPNIILDINDPLVQDVIKRVVSASIHEAFKNKQLEKELANKKKCCTSSTKLKIAILTALSSVATAIVTIALNNK